MEDLANAIAAVALLMEQEGILSCDEQRNTKICSCTCEVANRDMAFRSTFRCTALKSKSADVSCCSFCM